MPPHIVVNRNEPGERGEMPDHGTVFDAPDFVEAEDYVENEGKRINKPFVEKPADAENHNICIYYPHTVGGGYKALFRKIGNQASRWGGTARLTHRLTHELERRLVSNS